MKGSKLTLDLFCDARARCLKARERRESVRAPLVVKYGGETLLYRATQTETRRVEAANRAFDKASDGMFRLLDASPRDWRSGVPAHWVLFHLSYDDATRAKDEPLSMEPPCSYGSVEPKR